MNLSIVIPAYNEARNLGVVLDDLRAVVRDKYQIPCELIVVNDNSQDETEQTVHQIMRNDPAVRLVNRKLPRGFGRAVRAGLQAATGDVVVIFMADQSDDAEDAVAYYHKILQGYDCVFGSRFIRGAHVERYPFLKLIANRIVNRCIQWMFWTSFNDLTNAFKAYRMSVIDECGPFVASHFNISLEMALGALIRQYKIAQIPVHWYGRTWGSSNLRMNEMGRRYLSTLLMMFCQKILVADDLMAERMTDERDGRAGE